jgi:hypothetical protein
MSKKEKIKRIAFAFERLFMINPLCFDMYSIRNRVMVNEGTLVARNRTLLMDMFFVWMRIATVGVVFVNLLRRNYAWKSYLKIAAGYVIGTKVIPYTYYNLLELNRLRLLKKSARTYYEINNGNMDKIELVLNPSTPISKLRYLSL